MQPGLSQTIQPRLEQRLALAPQMLQRLEVLQAPLMELRALIRRELDQNPVLEELPARDEPMEPDAPAADAASAAPDGASAEAEELEFRERYDRLAQLDDDWREYFQQANAGRASGPDAGERHDRLLDSLTRAPSLQEYLLEQLGYADLSPKDRALATTLIGSLNDDGFLNVTVGELAETTGRSIADIERLLAVIQEFDPPGVGARDLRECLLLQLRRDGRGDGIETAIVRDHLDALAARQHPAIARALGVPVSTVHRAAEAIAALEPKPGRRFDTDPPVYALPEVAIVKTADGYIARPRRERLPRLRLRRDYRQMLENPATSGDTRRYLREKIRSGDALIRGVEQRQQTLLAIADEIIRRQPAFFERGRAGLAPMTMADVAKAIGVHETTVSRAVHGKFIETPLGVFELRQFFTGGYTSQDGRSVSNETVKDAIARLIAGENPAAPLSDLEIAGRLAADGLRVARRTVAKYREELGLPPSHQRRS